jgi:hypothetical protein
MLVSLFLLAFGQVALEAHPLPPVHLDRVYHLVGFGTVKPHSATLDIGENGLKLSLGSSAETLSLSAIAWFSVVRDSRALLPNATGALLNAAPFFAGQAFNMIRHQICALTFEYSDMHGGLHRPVLLFPEDRCQTVRSTLASLGVHEHSVPLSPARDFAKDRLVTGPKKFPVTTAMSIQVLDLAAGQGGTPDVFQSVMYQETIMRLKACKCFRQVLRAGEAAQDDRNLLDLELSIVAFQEGKPRVRELTGGAAKARVTAETVLKSKANEVLRDSILNGVAAGHADAFDACRFLAIREARSFQPEP